MASTVSPSTAKPAMWRILLGIALILPVPLLWGTGLAYATRDFYGIDRWLTNIILISIPAMTLAGVALLPLKIGDRVTLAIVLVPLACTINFIWGVIFVCTQFGDCL